MKNFKITCTIALLLIFAVAIIEKAGKVSTARTDPLQPQIAEKILRFHVLANSDSKEDQRVKLLVRDAIGGMMESRLENAADLEASRQIVEENLDEIVRVAASTLKEEGYDYGVNAYLSKVQFPEKTYGEYTFPAGEYEALRVKLGKSSGKNWWCVMYPSLCFVDSTYQIVPDSSKEKLKNHLTEEEYNSLLDHEDNVQYSFQIIEWVKDSLFS